MIIADIISTVEFDSTGNYLATGDKGGRVVLFERNEMVCKILLAYPICVLSGDQSSRGASCTLQLLTLPYLCASFSSRKKDANINFIQNFNRTSQNSIILNRSKSRRRLIRSNGAGDRMQHISSFPQTVLLYHLRVSSRG